MLWVAYLTAIGYGIDEAVWINVDETPVPYHVGGRHGWKKKHPVQDLRDLMVEKTSLQLKRSHCTLVASIASNENIQNVLPQVLLPKMVGKKKKRASALLLHALPPNIHIIPDTNGWMDLKIFKQYLNLLRDALAPLHPPKVVLVMDCHPSHYSWKTLSLLRRWKWKVLLTPSKLTGLLQPLDAWVFAAFKTNYTSQRCIQI
jgi:hypothetical protein